MALSQHDTETIRRLAGRCREIADSDENLAMKRRWTALNGLRHSGPPLLLVSPEGAWREIDVLFDMECHDEGARDWELALRRRLYHHDVIQDDAAFDPTFTVACPVTIGDYGIPFKQSKSAQATGAYHDEPVLKDLDKDLERLHFRTIRCRHDEIDQQLASAHAVFGDLLNVQHQATYWWTCGLTAEAIRLLGLENLMLAMYDNPDGLHRLMAFLSDEMTNFMEHFERDRLLDYNNAGDYIGSGNWGYTDELPSRERPVEGPVRRRHIWGFAESQETVGVGPEMFGEFVFPYQLQLLERFGLNYYGCCEASEDRWAYLRRIPRLRCVSVAPWSNQARYAELLGRDYVYCRKPNPSPVCVGFNEGEIRREFAETMRHAGTLNTVIVLKDTHTIENDPSRFARWVQIGRDALVA